MKTNTELGYKYFETIIKQNNIKYYEIVEDTYEYDNGLCLIEYADKECEEEIGHTCIDLDNIKEYMEREKEIEVLYNYLLENFKEFEKQNNEFDYSIESDIDIWKDLLKLFKTKDERLKALIMLYTYNVGLYELNNWDLADLKRYIYDTEEEKYFNKYKKLFELIGKGE